MIEQYQCDAARCRLLSRRTHGLRLLVAVRTHDDKRLPGRRGRFRVGRFRVGRFRIGRFCRPRGAAHADAALEHSAAQQQLRAAKAER